MSSASNFKIENGELIKYVGDASDIVIPDSVTGIGDYAFHRNYNLKSVVIPDSVTHIGNYAFADCRNLTRISIPHSVTLIGAFAFEKDTRLTNIVVAEASKNYASVDDVLFNKEKTVLLCYPSGREGAYCIPDGVTYIDEFSFAYCSHLTDLTIPDSVNRVGECAFWACRSLTSISIPNSVTHIGEAAFLGCNYLESIMIRGKKTTIGPAAFRDCVFLTIHAPSGSCAQNYAETNRFKFEEIS